MEGKSRYEDLEQRIEELEKEAIELKLAGEALRQSEERYRTVLDSIEEAYFEVDIAGNVELDQAFTEDHSGIETGPYVRICIEDNGRGMNEGTKKRIFEPFFTTHFIGRGLGMPCLRYCRQPHWNHHRRFCVGQGDPSSYLPACRQTKNKLNPKPCQGKGAFRSP